MARHRICTICRTRPQMDRVVRCEGCQRVFNALRVSDASLTSHEKRIAPTSARLRQAVMGGVLVPAPATLATHGHVRKPKRRVKRNAAEKAALKVLREEAAKRKARTNYIYLIGMEGNPKYVKIGEAFDPEDRYIGGQTFNPYTLVLLGYFEDTDKHGDKYYHQLHAEDHYKGEWFRPTARLLSRWGIKKSEFLRRCGGKKEATTATS